MIHEIFCQNSNWISLILLAYFRCLPDESSALLLYSLLNGNAGFLEYVLMRTDLNAVVCCAMKDLPDLFLKVSLFGVVPCQFLLLV